jgi:hypothetical protein
MLRPNFMTSRFSILSLDRLNHDPAIEAWPFLRLLAAPFDFAGRHDS